MRRKVIVLGAAAIAIVTGATASAAFAQAPPTVTVTAPSASTTSSVTVTVPAVATTPTVEQRVDDLQEQIDVINHNYDRVLIPITVLVGILALGGALGIVFSIRDQRRISQLHELTVTGELANQRRTEQSFGSFLEESQRTLTLVNDTLRLSKEATDQAANTMQLKATSSLATIETAAVDFVLQVAETGDFEKLVDVPENRARVRELVAELTALEGYLRLQDIKLPPYIAFLQGIDHYLSDNTTTALQALRRAAQETSTRQLQRMARFWVAELDNALGNFDQAARTLDLTENETPEGSVERFELQRLRAQAEFFEIASAANAPTTPDAKLRKVAKLLGRLEKTAKELETKTEHDQDQHANHEVAVTRADIYAWIAHDPSDLYRSLDSDAIKRVGRLAEGTSFDGIISFVAPDDDALDKVAALDEEALRAWAHLEADKIYMHQHGELQDTDDLDFRLLFGKAESEFALGRAGDEEHYRTLEHRAVEDQLGGHREHRHLVELAYVALICRARQLKLARETKPEAANQVVAQLNAALVKVTDELVGARDHNVTVFSHLQRRNISQQELAEEAKTLQKHATEPPKRKGEAAAA